VQSKKPPARRPTLTEVARLARVSPATVSRALNTPGLVAEETNRRIVEAVRKTGYVPNLLAGGLASNRSRLVAVVVPALARSIFNEMIEAMTEELMRARYQVMLVLSGYQDEHLPEIVDSVLARRPEGVILTGTVSDRKLRERLVSTGATIIETRTMPQEPIDYVVGFSHHDIGAAVAQIFHDLGRRAPLVVSPESVRATERLNGFTQAMARLGVRRVSTLTLPIPASFGQGRQALAEFLEGGGRADCVMCGSDWQAHGVITEARERGLKVPDDLAVIGFGNMDFADATEPSLTSVHIDGRKIGLAAARILLDRAAGRPQAPKVTDVGFTIVRRTSA
jgi:LacI family gluconate utilization system Gnt-I transcriptional repressor